MHPLELDANRAPGLASAVLAGADQQQRCTWAQMRSSRWWKTGAAAGRPSCRASRARPGRAPCRRRTGPPLSGSRRRSWSSHFPSSLPSRAAAARSRCSRPALVHRRRRKRPAVVRSLPSSPSRRRCGHSSEPAICSIELALRAAVERPDLKLKRSEVRLRITNDALPGHLQLLAQRESSRGLCRALGACRGLVRCTGQRLVCGAHSCTALSSASRASA